MNRAFQTLVAKLFSKHDTQRSHALGFSPIETLESRVFLSGTVFASVVQGNLHIMGDNFGNAIVMDQTGLSAGQVRITGAAGTQINNQANPVVLSGVARGVVIEMGRLADSVTMRNLSLPGSVWVYGQAGANTLTLNNVQIARSLIIQNGSTFSTTSIANSSVGINLVTVAGAGARLCRCNRCTLGEAPVWSAEAKVRLT